MEIEGVQHYYKKDVIASAFCEFCGISQNKAFLQHTYGWMVFCWILIEVRQWGYLVLVNYIVVWIKIFMN